MFNCEYDGNKPLYKTRCSISQALVSIILKNPIKAGLYIIMCVHIPDAIILILYDNFVKTPNQDPRRLNNNSQGKSWTFFIAFYTRILRKNKGAIHVCIWDLLTNVGVPITSWCILMNTDNFVDKWNDAVLYN